MSRTRLLDSWNRSRRERTRMPWGRRVASMEAALGADMTPGRHARWERLDLDRSDPHAQPGQDTEHQVDEHQADTDQRETEQQPEPEQQHDTDHEPEEAEQPEAGQPEAEPELDDEEVEP